MAILLNESEYDPKSHSLDYQNNYFYLKLMRDTVSGTTAIKNGGELYLPMPSAWNDPELCGGNNGIGIGIKSEFDENLASGFLAWSHPNPLYRAYLQRARFPAITANALRLLLGIASQKGCDVDLPSSIEYLKDSANFQGENLNQLYSYCLSEVATVSKHVLVVDFDSDDNKLKISSYDAESNINWDYDVIDGVEKISRCSFNDVYDGKKVIKEFYYDDDGIPSYRIFEKDKKDDIHNEQLLYKGKTYSEIPVFPLGSMRNHLDFQNFPLSGIADIAIAIYQLNADLRQAQFMTCNPTLFVFGLKESEKPRVLGTQVVVSIANPQAKAEYPKTDTSAFEHIRESIKDLFSESVSYGVSLIASGSKESGEALSLKKADAGASLINMCLLVGEGISSAIEFIAEMNGADKSLVEFSPNIEFAEMILTHNDINSLVNAWLQGAIDIDTVLDNLRDAGYIDGDKTNDQIKNNIETKPPKIPTAEVDLGGEDENNDGNQEA